MGADLPQHAVIKAFVIGIFLISWLSTIVINNQNSSHRMHKTWLVIPVLGMYRWNSIPINWRCYQSAVNVLNIMYINTRRHFAPTTYIEQNIVYYPSVNVVPIKDFKWNISPGSFLFISYNILLEIHWRNPLIHDYQLLYPRPGMIWHSSGYLLQHRPQTECTDILLFVDYACTGLKVLFHASLYTLSL
jgi:hypothetical protein